jgi:hypothetical protein
VRDWPGEWHVLTLLQCLSPARRLSHTTEPYLPAPTHTHTHACMLSVLLLLTLSLTHSLSHTNHTHTNTHTHAHTHTFSFQDLDSYSYYQHTRPRDCIRIHRHCRHVSSSSSRAATPAFSFRHPHSTASHQIAPPTHISISSVGFTRKPALSSQACATRLRFETSKKPALDCFEGSLTRALWTPFFFDAFLLPRWPQA